jgi:hypothetical protein
VAAGSIPAYGYLLQACLTMKSKPLPPLEEVRKYLDYDPETGIFTWKISRCGVTAGDRAGFPSNSRHRSIGVCGSTYLEHRLAWYLVTEQDPAGLHVDHKDRNPSNNRINNLRLATQSQNGKNTLGKGVYYDKHRGKYMASIKHNGKQLTIGRFDCPLIARLAYEDKKRELCGEFSPV